MKARLLILGAFCVVLAGCQSAGPQSRSSSSKAAQEIVAHLAAIREAGYPATLAELDAWIPTPPPDQNAAVIYNEAFTNLARLISPTNSVPRRSETLSDDAKVEFAALLATNQISLEKLHEAAKLGQSRYPVNWQDGFSARFPHLSSMNSSVRVLQCAAALRIEAGQTELAADSIQAMIRLARSIENEPSLISQMVRRAVLKITRDTTERALHRLRMDENSLAKLQNEFRDAEQKDDLLRTFAGERCLHIQTIRTLQQMSRKSLAEIEAMSEAFGEILGIKRRHKGHRKKIGDEDLLFWLEQMHWAVKAAEHPFPKGFEAFHRVSIALEAERQKPPAQRHLAADWFLPAIVKQPEGFADQASHLRATQAALAVERYRAAHAGELPSQLSDLVPAQLESVPADPYTGDPLLFKKLAKGYVVYSLGVDRQDDGGKEKPRQLASYSGYDITFIVER